MNPARWLRALQKPSGSGGALENAAQQDPALFTGQFSCRHCGSHPGMETAKDTD